MADMRTSNIYFCGAMLLRNQQHNGNIVSVKTVKWPVTLAPAQPRTLTDTFQNTKQTNHAQHML